MSTPVWTYAMSEFRVERQLDYELVEYGDGYLATGIKSVAWTHQDGTGGSDTSHRGYNHIHIALAVRTFSNMTAPLDFLQARIDAGFESFYIYDPLVEPNTANWDGTNTAGRHLVKFIGQINYAALHRLKGEFPSFLLREVRS